MDNLETATQNPGEKKNRVTLVYGPFNKGHLQPKWANLLERSHPSWQQVSQPRNLLLGVFCPIHRAQGKGHPTGNTQGPHSPKFSWQPSAFKCYGQTEFVTAALPGKAQKSSQPLLHVPLHSSGGCCKWEERTEWQRTQFPEKGQCQRVLSTMGV